MRAKRVDDNQREIVNALRQIGCSVADTSGAGKGFPDLVCGYRGKNLMLEIKDGEKVPSKRKLTPAQEIFHENWAGQITVVISPEQAIATVEYLVSK